jgi:hypothetical protein
MQPPKRQPSFVLAARSLGSCLAWAFISKHDAFQGIRRSRSPSTVGTLEGILKARAPDPEIVLFRETWLCWTRRKAGCVAVTNFALLRMMTPFGPHEWIRGARTGSNFSMHRLDRASKNLNTVQYTTSPWIVVQAYFIVL